MISNLSDFKEIWILWWFVAPLRDERAYCEIGFRENGAKPSAFHFVLGGGGGRELESLSNYSRDVMTEVD